MLQWLPLLPVYSPLITSSFSCKFYPLGTAPQARHFWLWPQSKVPSLIHPLILTVHLTLGWEGILQHVVGGYLKIRWASSSPLPLKKDYSAVVTVFEGTAGTVFLHRTTSHNFCIYVYGRYISRRHPFLIQVFKQTKKLSGGKCYMQEIKYLNSTESRTWNPYVLQFVSFVSPNLRWNPQFNFWPLLGFSCIQKLELLYQKMLNYSSPKK